MKKLHSILEILIGFILPPFILIALLVVILWRPFTLFQSIEIAITKLNKWFEGIAYIYFYTELDSNGLNEKEFEKKIYIKIKQVSWFIFIWILVNHFLRKMISKLSITQ